MQTKGLRMILRVQSFGKDTASKIKISIEYYMHKILTESRSHNFHLPEVREKRIIFLTENIFLRTHKFFLTFGN